MNLAEIRESYIQEGLGYLDASARICQDVLLACIAKSPLARNVTIKGGVVLQHLSHDNRRATQDLDFDFIRYSIDDDAIERFIQIVDSASDDISLEITGTIEELKHQDYSGKRVKLRLTDSLGTAIDTKLDIGVHKDTDFAQQEYCFELESMGDSVTLLVNSKEQIVVEKLKSLLRIGPFTTRYKDVFDLYYLLVDQGVDVISLAQQMRTCIFEDKDYREDSMVDVAKRLASVFENPQFITRISTSQKNWLDVPYEEVVKGILSQFSNRR